MSKPRIPTDGGGAPQGARAARGAPVSEADAPTARTGRGAKAARERTWSEVASFVIHFERRATGDGAGERRITAHKMQDGGITARWTGLAQQPMTSWIAEHLGDWGDEPAPEVPPGCAASTASATPAAPTSTAPTPHTATRALAGTGTASADGPIPRPRAPGVELAITAVIARSAVAGPARAADWPAVAPARARLRGGESFELAAEVRIVGAADAAVADAAPALPCKVEFFGRDLATRKSIRLGAADVGAAAGGAAGAYRAHLGGLVLPPGTYRLDSVALLGARPAKLAHAEGPVLEVG